MTTPESMAAEARRIAKTAPGHRGTLLVRYAHTDTIVSASFDQNTDRLLYMVGGIAVDAEQLRQRLRLLEPSACRG